MSKISSFFLSLKSKGIAPTLNTIYNGYFLVNKFIVFYRDLSRELHDTENDPSIVLKQVTLEDLQHLREKCIDLPPDFYCDLSHNFKTPCVALVEGELAAILWIVSPEEQSRFLELRDGDVEYNYSFVLPRFRGMRLAGHLISFMIRFCQQKNSQRMFAVVSATNVPQFKQMLDMGFVPVEALTHFGLKRPKATLKYVK